MIPPSSAPSRQTGSSNTGAPNVPGGPAHAWEDTGGSGNTWETAVQEDADGRLVVANSAGSIVQAIRNRRRRLEQNDYSLRNKRLVRHMIRYVYVVLDASRWMRSKDPVLPPGTRLETALDLLQEFVLAYFDENPLSHLGFILVKGGEAEILSPLSSNGNAHKSALRSVGPIVASEVSARASGGEFSLQNGLEVAGRSLGHQPRHGSREIVVVTAALATCDPGSILTSTLPRLKQANVRVSCFALAAEMHICRKIAEETKGSMGVCLDKAHCREWLRQQTVPPPSARKPGTPSCDMIPMGFPKRTISEVPGPIHAGRNKTVFGRTAYSCPQCRTYIDETISL
jgi:transcription initiation factor TFIIH subunit 2